MATIFVQDNLNEVVSSLNDNSIISIDIESSGLNPVDSRIILFQIGLPNGTTYVIDARAVNLSPLSKFLESRSWVKIAHNAKFEAKFTKHFLGVDLNNVFDTMLAHQILRSDKFPTNLSGVSAFYGGPVLDKSLQNSFLNTVGEVSQEQIAYAAKDAEVLFAIYDAEKQKLYETGQERVADIEFDLATVVADMELTGIHVDTNLWKERLEDYRERHKASREALHVILFDKAGLREQMGMFERDGINLNSSNQIGEAFTQLGINLPKTGKGNYATDERTLSTIDHPAAKELLNYRGYQKVISSYGESFLEHIHPFTGNIHTDFSQIGTETGRFSSKDPNIQQIPEDFRWCIGGVRGYRIIAADYSQMELRIIAELSQDAALLKAFEMGNDVHKSTASLMFNLPLDAISKEQRFIAKTINFGLTYGMGGPKLRDMLNDGKSPKQKLSINAVYEIISKYKTTYKGVTSYFQESGNAAFVHGESSTILGRKRFFPLPSRVDEEMYDKQVASIRRQGGNSPIQGTNADITKLAMVSLYRDFKDYGYQANIIAQVHDEIVVIAHKSNAVAVKDIVEESMVRSATQVLKSVPVKVDSHIDNYWKK